MSNNNNNIECSHDVMKHNNTISNSSHDVTNHNDVTAMSSCPANERRAFDTRTGTKFSRTSLKSGRQSVIHADTNSRQSGVQREASGRQSVINRETTSRQSLIPRGGGGSRKVSAAPSSSCTIDSSWSTTSASDLPTWGAFEEHMSSLQRYKDRRIERRPIYRPPSAHYLLVLEQLLEVNTARVPDLRPATRHSPPSTNDVTCSTSRDTPPKETTNEENYTELETWLQAKMNGRWAVPRRNMTSLSSPQSPDEVNSEAITNDTTARDIVSRDTAASKCDMIIGRWSCLMKGGSAAVDPSRSAADRSMLYERYLLHPDQWVEGLTEGGRVSRKELIERNKNKPGAYVVRNRRLSSSLSTHSHDVMTAGLWSK